MGDSEDSWEQEEKELIISDLSPHWATDWQGQCSLQKGKAPIGQLFSSSYKSHWFSSS